MAAEPVDFDCCEVFVERLNGFSSGNVVRFMHFIENIAGRI